MRLLNTSTLQMELFSGRKVPRYAILSHTWGDEEVMFEEVEMEPVVEPSGARLGIQSGRNRRRKSVIALHEDGFLLEDQEEKLEFEGYRKAGWGKIFNACLQARKSNPSYQYLWVDTCCIDKSSSAELSEAINSMYQWYQNAEICYAYLEDVVESGQRTSILDQELKNCRWFTRGWTLQELIAPETLLFFAKDWRLLGSKESLQHVISSITGISEEVLLKPKLLRTMSVARRMSWAADRETTRSEDIAYCLMGIFDVNMPLLYGEGPKAFLRLQEEIIKNSEDQSLFAWEYKYPLITKDLSLDDVAENEGILAHHPVAFRKSSGIVPYGNYAPYTMTNRGLQIQIPIRRPGDDASLPQEATIGILCCRYEDNISGSIGIHLEHPSDRYYRPSASSLEFVKNQAADSSKLHTLHIHRWGTRPAQTIARSYCFIRSYPPEFSLDQGICLPVDRSRRYPATLDDNDIQWNIETHTLLLPSNHEGSFVVMRFRSRFSSENLRREFILIAKLFPKGGQSSMAIIPCISTEYVPLHTAVEDYSETTGFLSGSFAIGTGNLRVELERIKVFDQDTFTLDIEYYSRGLIPDVPDIRVVDPI
jgi:hypothetical protein